MNVRLAAFAAMVLDAGLVIAFAAIGRASHEHGILGPFGLGLLNTLWPFAVGGLIGWAVSEGWNRPFAWWPTGVVVWASTLVVGMLLRAASGQGVQTSFVFVAALVLGVFLVGWRVAAKLIAKRLWGRA